MGDGNSFSGDDNIIVGNAMSNGIQFSGDDKFIMGSDGWVLVINRDTISSEADELLNSGLGNSFNGDVDNNQLHAAVNSLIDQVGQNFLKLIGSGWTVEQPTITQGTDSNDSSSLGSVFNSDDFLASSTEMPADNIISSDMASV